MSFVEDKAPLPQHDDVWKRTVYACGQRKDHQVRIHRAYWPPRGTALAGDKPFVAAVCERCEAHVIVYDPPSPDLTVILYGDPADVQGRVVDEVGKVVEEKAAPKVGVVVDEPAVTGGKK